MSENQMQQMPDEQLGLQTALDTLKQQRNYAYDQVVDLQANLVVMDRKMRAAELRAEQAKKLAQTFRAHTVTLHNILAGTEYANKIPIELFKDLDLENDAQSGNSAVPAP